MKNKQNKKIERVGRKTLFLLAGAVVALAAIAVLVVWLAGGPLEKEKPTLKIETPYIDLVLPLELEGLVTNDESTYGSIYTRAFYMCYNGEDIALWRVDFGDPNSGDWIGRLKTDAGDIPVAMTGFAISNEELAALGEEGSQLYGECMQGYSVMLEGIMADPRFTTERALAVGEDTEVKMTYWTVTLPDKMSVQEISKNGNYEAVFSGEVVGETVRLYRICIGEDGTGTLLGYFEIDGAKKPVSIESFTLDERGNWNADDYETAYRMMDTVNDVIEQITSSKNFSEIS